VLCVCECGRLLYRRMNRVNNMAVDEIDDLVDSMLLCIFRRCLACCELLLFYISFPPCHAVPQSNSIQGPVLCYYYDIIVLLPSNCYCCWVAP